jgi:hypothetical protein
MKLVKSYLVPTICFLVGFFSPIGGLVIIGLILLGLLVSWTVRYYTNKGEGLIWRLLIRG